MRTGSFSLVEVMIAITIVSLAVVSSYDVLYTVRLLNERTIFYGRSLVFARQKLYEKVAAHRFLKKEENGKVSGLTPECPEIKFSLIPGAVRQGAQKIELKITAAPKIGRMQISFFTYVTDRVHR